MIRPKLAYRIDVLCNSWQLAEYVSSKLRRTPYSKTAYFAFSIFIELNSLWSLCNKVGGMSNIVCSVLHTHCIMTFGSSRDACLNIVVRYSIIDAESRGYVIADKRDTCITFGAT